MTEEMDGRCLFVSTSDLSIALESHHCRFLLSRGEFFFPLLLRDFSGEGP